MPSLTLQRASCALVLVDYQQRLLPTLHGADAAVAEALFLADVAALLAVPVIGTEQNPAGLGPNVEPVRTRCAVTLAKTTFDACPAGLPAALRAARPELTQVVVAGCEAHVCLLQTALGLLRDGLQVFVVAPASASRTAADHALAMARLTQAGAVIVSTEMVVFEWLHACTDPQFKAVLQRLKARAAG